MINPMNSWILLAAIAVPGFVTADETSAVQNETGAIAPAEQASSSQPSSPRSRRRKVTVQLDDAGNAISTTIERIPADKRVLPVGAQDLTSTGPETVDGLAAETSQFVPPPPGPDGDSTPRAVAPGRLSRPFPRVVPGEIDFAPRLIPCYKPLYFEDANLERYGCVRGGCLQPVVSGVHFFGSVGLAPLKMLGAAPCQTVCPFPEAHDGFCLRPSRNLFGPTPSFDRLLHRSE